jgi:hypothetical protein
MKIAWVQARQKKTGGTPESTARLFSESRSFSGPGVEGVGEPSQGHPGERGARLRQCLPGLLEVLFADVQETLDDAGGDSLMQGEDEADHACEQEERPELVDDRRAASQPTQQYGEERNTTEIAADRGCRDPEAITDGVAQTQGRNHGSKVASEMH